MHCATMSQKCIWKQTLSSGLVKAWFLGLLCTFGYCQSSQIREDNNITFTSRRPIDVDTSTAKEIGREALEKIGYDEIIRLSERAGFVEQKLSMELASNGPVVATGFVRVFSRYAATAAVTSQADSPLPGPADLVALGIVVIGLVDAGLLGGYLSTALEEWLSSRARTDVIAGSAPVPTTVPPALAGSAAVLFPSADQLARKLGVSESQFHRQIKPGILQDLAPEARKLGTKNPDIGVDSAGRVVLRNPKTGDTTITDVLLESYIP